MKSLVRWLRFNLVGAIGMALQLAILSLLNRAMPGHYLRVTFAAIEVTLLHNFIWHWNYTWRDRNSTSFLRPLLRFHLSNGLVSFAGNLGLMWLLVHGARLPIIPADAIAIACCSIVNFYLGDSWVFAR